MSSLIEPTDASGTRGPRPPSQARPEGVAGAPGPDGRPALDAIADGVRTRSSYALALEVFEGPLDLLLHLVRRHELDILQIPIAFVAEKYLEYLEVAQALDVEIAGDYLVMAATLAWLKSRELLPRRPELDDEAGAHEEGGLDPREELIRRLIDYERFKAAADRLDARPVLGRDSFGRGAPLEVVVPIPDLLPVTMFRLAEAFVRVLQRAAIVAEHEVELEPITVRERMRQLSLVFAERERISFDELFLARTWRSERELRQALVVTLISVLELVKLGIMGVDQIDGQDRIDLARLTSPERFVAALERWDEQADVDADRPAVAPGASGPQLEGDPED